VPTNPSREMPIHYDIETDALYLRALKKVEKKVERKAKQKKIIFLSPAF
jgi:hypothetical protein